MRVLFLHTNFPAQYRHVAHYLGRQPGNEVLFASSAGKGEIAGVRRLQFEPHRTPNQGTHPYAQRMEKAVLNGQAAYRALKPLQRKGYRPDLICAHSGWGAGLYMRDLFPEAKLLCLYEWYYDEAAPDARFGAEDAFSEDDVLRNRSQNAPILLDLAACDWGYSPTEWQRSRFPEAFQPRISVLHEGVDTDSFAPKPDASVVIDGTRLSRSDEVVTYVARGMEPYRGFPQFMEAAARLLAERPRAHVIVVGEDRVCYGRKLPEGESWKARMLEQLDLDEERASRLHFTGLLPYSHYRQLLQCSSAHVYLTVPFVLSWSMIEAMATGALVVASDTEPVREVIEDGRNGLLVDFFAPELLAERVAEVLERPEGFEKVRAAARETAVEGFGLGRLLVEHAGLMGRVVGGEVLPAVPLTATAD